MLQRELGCHNPALLEKPFLVALNKIDQEGAEPLAAEFCKKYFLDPKNLFIISAKEETQIKAFKQAIVDLAFSPL